MRILLVHNIYKWFEDLSIVHRGGGFLARTPKFLALCGATVRELKDLNAPFVSKMWRVAIKNQPIPQFALARALVRARIDVIQDTPTNHARMGLMKAYHLRKNRKQGGE